MRLFHVTDAPLEAYFKWEQRGLVRLSDSFGGSRETLYLRTEEGVKDQIRKVFEFYSAAKIITDGVIVPNLVVSLAKEMKEEYRRFGNETDKDRRILNFITTSNVLYKVDFDKFYLKNNESVFVDTVSLDQISGTPKAFDLVLDYANYRVVMAIGISASSDQSKLVNEKPNMDHTLYFLFPGEGLSQELEVKQYNTLEGRKGFFKVMKDSVQDFVSNIVPTNIIGAKRVQPDFRHQPSKSGIEDGVIAMSSMTNGLLGVIYSTGLFNVWSICSGRCVAQADLFDSMKDGEAQRRITQAKIQTMTMPLQSSQASKTFKLAIAFSFSNFKEMQQHWLVEQMELSFSDLPLELIDIQNQDYFDISPHTAAIERNQVLELSEGEIVTELNMEISNDSSHLWMVTFSKFTKQSSIQDLYSAQTFISDLQSFQESQKLHDLLDLPYTIKQSEDSIDYLLLIRDHFISKLTVQGRFTHDTIILTLRSYGVSDLEINACNGDLVELIKRFADRCNYDTLKEFLERAVITEQENSSIICYSKALGRFPLRLIIRQSGLSLLKPDSLYTTFVQRYTGLATLVASQSKDEQLAMGGKEEIISNIVTSESLNEPIRTIFALFLAENSANADQIDEIVQAANFDDLRELIEEGLQESFGYQDLSLELSRLISVYRFDLEHALNQLSDLVIKLLLEGNAESSFVPSQDSRFDQYSAQYTPQMIRFIELGVANELKCLQQLLRDLLMLRIYLQLNFPLIGINYLQAQQLSEQISLLSFQYQQIAAFNQIALNSKLNINSLKPAHQKYVLSRKVKTCSFLAYFILSQPQIYNLKDLQSEKENNFDLSLFDTLRQNPSIDERMASSEISGADAERLSIIHGQGAMFANILVRIIQRYTCNRSLKLTFVPRLIRKLYSLKQFKILSQYLKTCNLENNISLSLLKALISTYQDPPAFLDDISSCIQQFQVLLARNQSISAEDIILDKAAQNDIRTFINSKTQNEVTQFYLVILSQLQQSDERFALYVLNSALIDERIPAVSEDEAQLCDRDHLLDLMFQKCTIQKSPEYLYYACQQMKNNRRRKEMLAQFLEIVCHPSVKGRTALLSKYVFSHEDVDLALDCIFAKFISISLGESQEDRAQSVMHRIKRLEDLLALVNIVGIIYARQIQIGRLLWQAQRTIGEVIAKESIMEQHLENQVKWLEIQHLILMLLHCNAEQIGEHLMITDDGEVTEHSRKRKTLDSQMEDVYENSEDLISEKGYSLLNETDKSQLKFCQGSLKIITKEEISRKLVIVEARIKCAYYTKSECAKELLEILVEIKEFNLALHLGHQHKNLGISYPMAYLLQSLSDEDKDFQYSMRQWHNLPAQLQVKQIKLENPELTQFQVIIDPLFTFTLDMIELINLAKAIVSTGQALPASLEHHIVANGHIRELIVFYQSEVHSQESMARMFKESVALVKKYSPQSVKDLINSDISLLLILLEDMNAAKEENENELQDNIDSLQIYEDNRKNALSHAALKLDISNHLANNLEQLFGQEFLSHASAGPQIEENLQEFNVQGMRQSIAYAQEMVDLITETMIEVKSIMISELSK